MNVGELCADLREIIDELDDKIRTRIAKPRDQLNDNIEHDSNMNSVNQKASLKNLLI